MTNPRAHSEHRASRPAPSGGLLTPEQLAHYASKAWVAVPGFFSTAQTAQIAAWVEELERRPERPGVEMVYHEPKLDDPSVRLVQRIENFCAFHAGFGELVQGRLKSAIEALMGEPAVLFKDKINFKMAGGAGFEAHQDQQAGWSVYAPLFVTALVSIDAATLANGCLEIADAPRVAGLIGEEWKPLTARPDGGLSRRFRCRARRATCCSSTATCRMPPNPTRPTARGASFI